MELFADIPVNSVARSAAPYRARPVQHLLGLDRVCDKAQELDFGLYQAIRYAPK